MSLDNKQLKEPLAEPVGATIAAFGIALNAGERYVGVIVDDIGQPSHHLILLPGEAENITWPDAVNWAATVGGELPTRAEQALLFANAKAQFQPRWYWSGTQHADDSDYAWYQDFYDGYQGNHYKSYEGRARAVRRLEI